MASTGDEPAVEDRLAGAEDLDEAMSALSGLVTRPHALEGTLGRIADWAVAAIPGAEGAGLVLHEAGRQQTIVTTTDFVRVVDGIQYSLAEGPCISAVADLRTYRSGNLSGEQRWTRFGPRAGRLGVHSALSLPLQLEGRVVGALNVYAHARSAFDDRSQEVAEIFAPQAAVNVANARTLAQAERIVEQLQTALTTRAEIDQAIGILMSRRGGTSADAFERLRAMSQGRSVKVADIAREIVEEAVRRVRARRTDPETGP